MGLRPLTQTQDQSRDLGSQEFDVVDAELDCCKQSNGHDVFWFTHQLSRMLRGTELGSIDWAPTRAKMRGTTAKERIVKIRILERCRTFD